MRQIKVVNSELSSKLEPISASNSPVILWKKRSGNFLRQGRFFIAAFALLVAGLWTGCWFPAPKKAEDRKPPAVLVEVTEIVLGPIERVLATSSSLEAEQEVRVIARIANRVVRLLVEEGDLVVKNQLLAQLEDDIQKSALLKAENQTAKAGKEFQRQESLFQQNLISEQVFQDSRYDLRQLELSLEDAKRELGYTEIRAPIAGTIARRFLKLGDEVSHGQHLFDIVDFNSIVARLFVPEKELGALKIGQEVRVTANAFPNQLFKAYVDRISPIVEAGAGMIKVTVAFKDIGSLRPGMSVNASIVVETKPDAVLVPKQALAYDGDRQYVFRLKPGRQVERIQIDPGLEDAFMMEAKSEIQPGDQIVVAGQTGLKDGARVRLPNDPKPDDAPPAEDKERNGPA